MMKSMYFFLVFVQLSHLQPTPANNLSNWEEGKELSNNFNATSETVPVFQGKQTFHLEGSSVRTIIPHPFQHIGSNKSSKFSSPLDQQTTSHQDHALAHTLKNFSPKGNERTKEPCLVLTSCFSTDERSPKKIAPLKGYFLFSTNKPIPSDDDKRDTETHPPTTFLNLKVQENKKVETELDSSPQLVLKLDRNYSPEEIAEYIYSTGDESGIAQTVWEMMEDGQIMASQDDVILFLMKVQKQLESMRKHEKQTQ